MFPTSSGQRAFLRWRFVALTGWWDRAVITLYSVISAVILASLIGLPIAILASFSERRAARILLMCDTAQTFPSFVYLSRDIQGRVLLQREVQAQRQEATPIATTQPARAP